jgi:uncharacterized membrane protein
MQECVYFAPSFHPSSIYPIVMSQPLSSHLSQQPLRNGEAIQGRELHKGIFDLICADHPDFGMEDYLSLDELNHYRRRYLSELILQEKGDVARLDRDVMEAIRDNSILSAKIVDAADPETTFGQRIADQVATFGGSWTFIIAFFSFILLWILVNIFVLVKRPFDPFPFILLNLILSCLASIQAPIIMMSQNRQEQKDRQRGEQDYKINLKAELEIQLLSEKIDHLIVHQNRKMLEIQELQTDYLEDLMRRIKGLDKGPDGPVDPSPIRE